MEKSTSSAINSLPEYEPDKIKSRPAFSTSSAAYYPGGNGSSSKLQNPFIPTSSLQRKRKRFATTWSIAVLSVIASACAVFYSHRVMVNQNALPSFLESQPGTTVLVVNILSHLVAFLCWSLFTDTMEALRWALACRPQGILLTSFLAMSRATPIAGAIYLCLTKGAHQIWSIQRILCHTAISVLGLVLITNVSYKTIYTPYSRDVDATNATQRVVAGLAPVSSYGLGYITNAIVNAFAAYTISFLTDPRFVASVGPVQCNGTDCLSLFLPGGMNSVRYDDGSGNSSLFSGDFPGDYTTIVINDAPGYQIEYGSIDSVAPGFEFNQETDCQMYLQSLGDGILLCMVEKGPQLLVGWAVCPMITYLLNECQSDLTWTDTINWNTTVTMYSRKASVAYDSQNISILSIESISEPISYPVPVADFQLYCSIVLAPIPTVLNMSANSTVFDDSGTNIDVEYSISFLLRLYESQYQTYSDGGLSILRGFIAVPFQFSTALQQMGDINLFPEDNHVTASLSKASYRAIIDSWTVWVFGGLAALLTIWGLGCLCWISFYAPSSPNTSLFPEIDITSKGSIQFVGDSLDDLAKTTRSYGLGNGMSKAVVRAIRGKRVYCGAYPGRLGEKVILLVMEKGQVDILNQHEKYT